MKKLLLIIGFVFATTLLTGCEKQNNNAVDNNMGNKQVENNDTWKKDDKNQNSTQIANPASQNCIDKGGELELKQDSNGGAYGVCFFEDNRQCEEWALMRGDCPDGGVKITGYDNEGQIFCAISGGEVDMQDFTCLMPNGDQCVINEFDVDCSVANEDIIDIKKLAQAHCDDENISKVYECGDYYGVVSSLIGGGTTFYTTSEDGIKCPVVAPASMSDDCGKYLVRSDCAQVDICEKEVK